LSYDPEAAERVRQVLSGRDGVVEKRMVGGLSFLVNGNMCCGITDRALMVRAGAKGQEQALQEPHVQRAAGARLRVRAPSQARPRQPMTSPTRARPGTGFRGHRAVRGVCDQAFA
jgi:TfoX/Sxy family transcriptional regulator of competence genes